MARRDQQLKTLQLGAYCSRAGYQRLHQVLDMSRILYNALQERRDAYRHRKKQVSYADQQNQLTLIKQDLPEYREIDNRVWRRLETHPLETGQVLQVLLPLLAPM